ncbi:MAG: alkyl hydroperoxide reductase subunit F [Oligoflexus sp.]
MLDTAMKDQLKNVFQVLKANISLVVAPSSHAKQEELISMLSDVASVSEKIECKVEGDSKSSPYFRILKDGKETGVAFQGIPGGHEFTSLILGILNADGHGKLPDQGIVQRIKRLKPGLEIRTFISLSCENCPDVVQALNQVILAHGSMKHTMVDGGMVPEELETLKIQGVPSVIIDGQLIHSGRASLADLLSKLEAKYASDEADAPQEVNLGHADVLVIGGGPAGASAAIYSVRKGLKTMLVAEKLGGQVQETKGIENLISVVYTEGPQLTANIEQHLRSYPVEILEHRRVAKILDDKIKTVHLNSGEYLTADSIIIATGAKWREIGVKGEKEYLGRGVAYCPHCDGPYYKGKKVAVIGGGNSGVEAAIDLAGICQEVVLLEYADQLKADDVLVKKLYSLPNVSVVTSAKTEAIKGNGEKVVGMSYQNRVSGDEVSLDLDGIFVQIGLSPNSGLVQDVVEINKFGEIVVDSKGRTSRPGIYAAGDVTTVPYKQIVIAMGEGAKVALTAFEDRMRA